MNEAELEFTKVLREHKGTVYTVCYMFSDNEDEVADLYQDMDISCQPEYLHIFGKKEASWH